MDSVDGIAENKAAAQAGEELGFRGIVREAERPDQVLEPRCSLEPPQGYKNQKKEV